MFDMNRGYNGYSMSNRAAEAYSNGEKPLSKWTKSEIIEAIAEVDEKKAELFKKVSLSVLKTSVLKRSSWHHTSSRCNRTDFYSIDIDYIETASEERISELCNKPQKEEAKTNIFKGDIFYLEWSGTRNHPHATERCLENVNIEERGQFYYITNDSGREILKKKIGSNGTRVIKKEEK